MLLPLLLLVTSSVPPQSEVEASSPAPAAQGGDAELSFAELDRVLLGRHAMSETGRSALKHLVESRLLEALADEEGLVIPESEVERKIRELERDVVGSGEARDLEDLMRKNRVTEAKLRRFMRCALINEKLARRALGVPADEPVTGEQQSAWLDELIRERGYETFAPPWKDGIVARCGDLSVTLDEYIPHLRQQIPPDEIREACYLKLVELCLVARMPDLAPQALEREIDLEVERRRRDAESDPKYKGVKFEALLGAQGMTLATLRADPSVRVPALAKLWVDRKYTQEDLRHVYEAEREYFDDMFGEAIETWVIFLQAAEFPNDLLPRSMKEAEKELLELRGTIRSRSAFEKLAAAKSDDKKSREADGALGFVTRGDPRVPAEIRIAAFEALASGAYDPLAKNTPEKRLLGPLRTSTGCALLWLGGRRPAPSWDLMALRVHQELRRRQVEDVLPRGEVATYLDPD